MTERYRTSIPERCGKPGYAFSTRNGYRECREHYNAHALDGGSAIWELASYQGGPIGPCDYPLDGLGAARYLTPEKAEAERRRARRAKRNLTR